MEQQQTRNFWLTSRGIVAATGIGFLLYFLVIEHGEHLFPYLPYFILLLCPFMHFFMHRSHGHDGEHKKHGEVASDEYQRGHKDGMKESQTKAEDYDARR